MLEHPPSPMPTKGCCGREEAHFGFHAVLIAAVAASIDAAVAAPIDAAVAAPIDAAVAAPIDAAVAAPIDAAVAAPIDAVVAKSMLAMRAALSPPGAAAAATILRICGRPIT